MLKTRFNVCIVIDVVVKNNFGKFNLCECKIVNDFKTIYISKRNINMYNIFFNSFRILCMNYFKKKFE